MNLTKGKDQRGGRLRKFIQTPKGHVLAFLLFLAVLGEIVAKDYGGLLNAGAAILTGLLIDLIIGWAQKRKRLFSDGAVVTGMIIGMVLSSSVAWYLAVLTAAIAILSKQVLKIKRKPIFNPAALGLLIASGLLSTGQSWWGGLAEIPVWCIVFVIIGGFLITNKINKFPQVLAFLGVYFVLLLIFSLINASAAGDAMRVPFVNAALFLAFYMLTDPPTSPTKPKDQVWFGVLTAVVGVAFYMFFGGLAYLFVGLLVANAINAWRSYRAA